MINNIKKNILLYSLYFFSGIIYILFFNYIFKIVNVYQNYIIILLIVIYILFGLSIYFKKINYIKILYYITLFILLFLRISETGYNFEFYLFEWLKYIFKNKIILINILGNILLFIPMGIINKKLIKSILIIILIEVMQLILNKGIFDIIDIILNTFGVIIGMIGVLLWKKIKIKRKKILEMKK